jgi:DNA-3-methyladenine glycosylase II
MQKIRINKKKLRPIRPTTNAFLSLARAIIYQQISTKAGDAILKRFLALFGKKKITPENFLALTSIQLKSAGLSPQKQSYLVDLAEKFVDETIHLKHFSRMNDEEVKEHLIKVKGIGPWTADMFLIFALNRPNILPVGDLGIVKGFQKVFNLKSRPAERTMRRLAKPYEGEHTNLSLYLWGSLDTDVEM